MRIENSIAYELSQKNFEELLYLFVTGYGTVGRFGKKTTESSKNWKFENPVFQPVYSN